MVELTPIPAPKSDFHSVEQIFSSLDVLDATRAEYVQRSKPFLNFVCQHGFSNNALLEFKRYLRTRNDVGVATKNKWLTSARIMLKELHRIGCLPTDITVNVKSFQQSKKHKRMGITDGEMKLLNTYVSSLPPSPQSDRIMMILSFLAYQGLRQIEIVRLKVADVDLIAKTALIQGKGRDDKELIDLHPLTVSALEKYLKTNAIADGFLFVSASNNSLKKPLTTRGLRQVVKKHLTQAGIQRHVHGFRHFFTTKLIQNYQGDLLEVAKYTRHRSLEMLQVYNDSFTKKRNLPRYYSCFSEGLF